MSEPPPRPLDTIAVTWAKDHTSNSPSSPDAGAQKFSLIPRGVRGNAPGGIGHSPLEHQDREAGLAQPVGRHRAAEARADDDGVEMLGFSD